MDDNGEHFDGREMTMVHKMFRREFGLAGGVVRRVACGDTARAEAVAWHLRFIGEVLHHHHSGEDHYVWPLLERRAPSQVSSHVQRVTEQHRRVDALHADVDAELPIWGASASAAAGEKLGAALDRLATSLVEHMDYEESHVVPVMEAHIGMAEWNDIVKAMTAELNPDHAMLILGMSMYEADPDLIERTIGNMPVDMRGGVRCTAALTYAEHAQLIHGTATPPRSAQIAGSATG